MPFQILDIILVGIMLLSGVLALMRGFTREVLSLLAWGLGAGAAYYAVQQQKLLDLVLPYVDKPILAQIAVGAVAFLVVLVIVSVISVKISDRVVDSSVGAFDRTLGFLYGLVRGFAVVVIAYLFYGWLAPPEKQATWVREARSLPVIKMAGEMLLAYVPPDIAETLANTALLKNLDAAVPPKPPAEGEPGYQGTDTQSLEGLIEGTGAAPTPEPTPPPAIGQSPAPGTTP